MDEWDAPFGGVIGRYHHESTPWWPSPKRARDGAPNIVLVVLDDVGFAQLGCFGSDLRTPVLDGLASEGLRFRNFHTTALCSPTRACLLTGRNHHSVGMGRVTDLATGFPGYHSRIPRSAGFLSEILREAGWATWAVGKWHLTPEDECHHGASRARWPLGRGFERFYGFFHGETHQFAPALVSDNHQIEPPAAWQDGYHLSADLVDQASSLVTDLRSIDVAKPFFMYLCFGACHSPHHAPQEWLDRERGRFDGGWDRWREETFERQLAAGLLPSSTKLSPRPDWVPAWETLGAEHQALYARYMEAFAAYLAYTDAQLGRLVETLRHTGDLDRTLLIAVSDNGASSEGGPTGSLNDGRMWNMVGRPRGEALVRIDEIGGPRCHNNYPWGWTIAGNTPFRRWKREVHEGGVADPCVVRFPGCPDPGAIREQYVHAVDILPTVLELAGVSAPEEIDGIPQRPIDGVSFATALTDASAPAARTVQYFEMFACRALYKDGWKAVTFHPIQADEPGLDAATWELYDVRVDPSECDDLAAREPDRLAAMIDEWWARAEAAGVLPLDNRPFSSFVLDRPRALPDRREYRYRPGDPAVPEAVAANLKNRSHTITTTIDVPEGGGEGVLIAQGSLLGGWALYVLDGRLVYLHNLAGYEQHRVEASSQLAAGQRQILCYFEKSAEHAGVVTLSVDGEVVGRGEVPRFTPVRFSITGAGLTAGRDASGLAVSDDYVAPFPWTGAIAGDVVIEVDGDAYLDPEGEADFAITTQ